MSLLLALLPRQRARTRVSGALEPLHEVRYATDWNEIHTLARASQARLTIIDPYASGKFDLEECAAIRREAPYLPLLPYAWFPPDSAHDILELAALGIRNVIVFDEDDSPALLRPIVMQCLAQPVVGRVLASLEDLIPVDLVPVFRYALSEVHRPLRPDDLARAYHRHAKTLREHLRQANLPLPEKVIGWAQLFCAASLWEDSDRTVEDMALALHCSSAAAFRKKLRAYAKLRPADLKRHGDGVEILLQRFRECGPAIGGSAV